MNNELKIGDEVVRTKGGMGYAGNKGKVVEISGERLRVFWHTSRAPKHTWINRDAVAPDKAHAKPVTTEAKGGA